MFLPILGLILVFVATLVPIEWISWVTSPQVQLLLGIFAVSVLVYVDTVFGFLLGLGVLIMYLRVYANKMGVSIGSLLRLNKRTDPVIMDYLTPQHLRDAQNNVFDPSVANVEIKGIKGVYGEEVYGAQGMDHSMPGYSTAEPGEAFVLQ